jgi:virulence-associated protein VagC
MQTANINLAQSAAQKMATGALMTLGETAAWFDVSDQTVHRMPLQSIRLGRSLRFDPRDVSKLIEESKEAVICPHQQATAQTVLTASAVVAADLAQPDSNFWRAE